MMVRLWEQDTRGRKGALVVLGLQDTTKYAAIGEGSSDVLLATPVDMSSGKSPRRAAIDIEVD